MLDSLTAKNALFLSIGLTSTYLLYKTVRLYLKKRKYRHIPGPPTEGYLLLILITHFIYIFKVNVSY